MSDPLPVAADLLHIVDDLQNRLAGGRADTSGWRIDDIAPLNAGHSGFTYLVRTGIEDRRLVLRLSPPNARIAGPNDVGRQGRIMTALGAAGIPVPGVVDYSSEPVIDGRAFVLMDWVDGQPWDASELSHREIARQAVDIARQIGEVPLSASGIEDEQLLLPTDELDRWSALLPRCPEWLRGPAQLLHARLSRSAPTPERLGLVHGDFHYGNLMFRDGRIVAVIDWEIANLGDPLFDLGALAVAGLRRRYAPEPNPTGSVEVSCADLAAMYPTDPSRLSWFVAASCFKYSVILGYNYELHRRGKRTDYLYESLLATTRGLVDDAHDILQAA